MGFLIADSSSINLIQTRWLFGTACLAAAVLGVLTLRWLLARRTAAGGGLKDALRGWWNEEIWLGGPFRAELRQALGQACFTAAFALLMLRCILSDSYLVSSIPRLLADLIFWYIAAKLLLFTRYSLRQLLAAVCFAIPLLLCASRTGSQILLYQVLLIPCVKDIDLRKAFRIVFRMAFCLVAAIMLLAALGLIATLQYGAGSVRPRYTFGFTHPNVSGKYLLFLASGWFLLRFDRIRLQDWLGIAALLVFCSSVVDSRSASLGILTLLAAGLIAQYLPRLWHAKPLRLLWGAAPLAAAAASFLLAAGYQAELPFWAKLNRFSSDRLRLFHLAVSRLSVTLFGQVVGDAELYTLDNLYLYNFYALGMIGFAVYFGLICCLLYQCGQSRWAAETIVFLSFLVYGCFERGSWANTCPAILLLANAIYWPAPGRAARISQDPPPTSKRLYKQ